MIEQELELSKNTSLEEKLINQAEKQNGIIVEGNCKYMLDGYGNKIQILSYTGTDEEFRVPDSIGYIINGVFSNNPTLKKIVFSGTIPFIGRNNFNNCPNIEKITFLDFPSLDSEEGFDEKTIEFFNLYKILNIPSIKVINFRTSKSIPRDYLSRLKTIIGDSTAITIYDIPFTDEMLEMPEKERKDQMHRGPYILGNTIYPKEQVILEFFDFKKFKDTPVLNQYSSEQLDKITSYCESVLYQLGKATDSENIDSNIFLKMNYEEFITNMKKMLDNGYTREEATQLIIHSNYELLSYNIENAFTTYQWLLDQKLLTKEVMDRFFFDGEEINNIEDLKKYYDKYQKLPKLFSTLLVNSNDDQKLTELRDRLTYISALELLDGDKYKVKKARRIMQQDLFQSIVEEDKDSIKKIKENFLLQESPEEFEGIYTPLYRKMNGIDSNWFDEFFDLYDEKPEIFTNFISSLTAIKDKSMFKYEKERAIFLKNEVVGRLLYVDLLKFCEGKNFENETDIVKAYKESKMSGTSHESVENLVLLAKKSKEKLFTEPMIIKAMLKIDPYSFDALKESSFDNVTKEALELKYVKDADNNGYYISDEEREKYRTLNHELRFSSTRSDKTFIEYLCNKIDIPMDDSQLTDKLEERIRDYVNHSSLDKLYDICNIFDFHLRHNKEYDVAALQGNDFAKDSKKVFDRTSEVFEGQDEMPRILYCLFNLNRLSKHDYDLKVKKWDDMRLANNNQRVQYFAKINSFRKNIAVLEKYNISLEQVRNIYESIKRGTNTVNISKSELVTAIFSGTMPDAIQKSLSSSGLSMAVVCPSEDAQTAVTNIIALYNQYPEDIDALETAAKEQKVDYECKDIFAKYAIERFDILMQDKQDDLVSAISLKEDKKINSFQELGYAVEVQEDEKGELILACYCKGIIDAFSIHLKNLNLPYDDLEKLKRIAQKNKGNYRIAHTQINDRLRIYENGPGKIDAKSCDDSTVHTGFNRFSSNSPQEHQRNDIAFKNAITFGTGYMFDNFDEVMEERKKTNQADAKQEYPQVSDNNQPFPPETLSANLPEINNTQSESSLNPELEEMFTIPKQQSTDRFMLADADLSHTSEANVHKR